MSNDFFLLLVSWLISHGYPIFFLAVLLEGVMATIAGGVVAALGYFNFWLLFFLAVAGDLSADLVYYAVGYYSRSTWIKSHGHKFGLNDKRFGKLEKLLHNNLGKAMILVKLSPLLPIPGLLTIGSSRAPLKKFIRISLAISMPKALVFLALGYYTGRAYRIFSSLLVDSQYLIWILLILIVLFYAIYRMITSRLAKRIDRD